MKTEILTIRVSAKMKEQLKNLAKTTERTPIFLAKEAIEEYLLNQKWQVQAIQNGVDKAQRGDFASDEDIAAAFRKVDVSYED